MTAVAAARLSYADYLQLEAESGGKHEFWSGEVWAMGGGSLDHALIATAAAALLRAAIGPRTCRVLNSDWKLWLSRGRHGGLPRPERHLRPRRAAAP
jgi:hypothetical protein